MRSAPRKKNHPDVTIKFTAVNVHRQISPPVREIFIEVDRAENDVGQLSETYGDIRTNVLEGKGILHKMFPFPTY